MSSILWRTFNNDGSVIALYTILLVLVGVGQLGLFWWQLHLIRDSLKDAHTAAEAAKESADRTREALAHTRFVASRQLRAYLCIDMLDFSGDAVGGLDFRLSEATLTFVLKNKGETPAYNISVETNLVEHLNNTDTVLECTSGSQTVTEFSMISSDHEYIVETVFLYDGQRKMNVYLDDAGRYVISGKITFTDVFSKRRRWMEFSCWCRPTNAADNKITRIEFSNRGNNTGDLDDDYDGSLNPFF